MSDSGGMSLRYGGDTVNTSIIFADSYADTNMSLHLQDGVRLTEMTILICGDQTKIIRPVDGNISLLPAFYKVWGTGRVVPVTIRAETTNGSYEVNMIFAPRGSLTTPFMHGLTTTTRKTE